MTKYLYILGVVLIIVALGFFLVPEKSPYSDLIHVTSPVANQVVTSPLTVTGEARGTWYFEASFPVKLLDAEGNLIVQNHADAKEDWMTENFVSFVASLEFSKPATQTGTLVLQNDNPSGLPENDKEIRIPIRFGEGSVTLPPQPACKIGGCSGQICSDQDMVTTCEYRKEYACYESAKCERQESGECGWTPTESLNACLVDNGVMQYAKLYFGDSRYVGPDCAHVSPAQRVVTSTPAVARVALTELLKGPTQQEKASGFFTSIPEGVVVQSLSIKNGVAYADFNNALQDGVAGSCKVEAIRSQIIQTLKRFSTVTGVVISINGKTEGILQP